MTIVVGISGSKRHGKSTAANCLRDRFGFKVISFADTLKNVCSEAFGIDRHLMEDGPHRELELDSVPGWSIRKILQHVGTEMFRSEWPSIWIDRWEQKAKMEALVVVPDVRFQNEVDKIKTFRNHMLILVQNPNVEVGDQHASETGFQSFSFDAVISNDGKDLAGYSNSVCDAVRKKFGQEFYRFGR